MYLKHKIEPRNLEGHANFYVVYRLRNFAET